jgi:hypothetical protein
VSIVVPRLASRRPAETVTGTAAAAATLIVAVTGADPAIAAALVAVVGFLPTLVSFIVSTVRRGTQTAVLVDLTGDVATTVKAVLHKTRDADLKEASDALAGIAATVEAWANLLAVEPASGGGEESSTPG